MIRTSCLVYIAILVARSQNVDWYFRQVMQYNLYQNIKCRFVFGSLCIACGHKTYVHKEEPKKKKKQEKNEEQKNLRGTK
jgi:hypothetical protein